MFYYLAIILATFFWSTSFPVIKYAFLKGLSPLPLLFYRFLFATLFVIPLKRSELVPRDGIVIFLGFINAIGFSFQFMGQKLTTASKAALLVNLYVVWVLFLSRRVLKESIQLNKIIALILAVTGAFILVGAPSPVEFNLNKGDLMVGAAGLVWALYIVYSKVATLKMDPFHITRGVMIWTFLFLLLFYPLGRWDINPTPSLLLFGAYLGIFCSIVPYFLYTYSLKGIKASTSSFLLLMEVLMALLWSYLFLGELLKKYEIIGAILILSSLILTSFGEKEVEYDKIQKD